MGTQSCLRNGRNRGENRSPGRGWAAASDPPFPVTTPLGSPGQVPGADEAPRDGLRGGHSGHTASATRGRPRRPPVTSEFWKYPPGKALMAWLGLSAETPVVDEQGGGENRKYTEHVARAAGGAADGWQSRYTWSPWARLCAHM